MNAKSKVGMVIFVLILVGWTLYGIISGALGLTKGSYTEPTVNAEVGKLCEVEIDAAVEAYEVKHTLNLIPTGKEHFYLCLTEDEGIPLLVKAKTSWYNANFDEDGFAYSTVKVKGEVMKMDSKFVTDLNTMNRQIKSELGFTISTTTYISSNYKTPYALRLASGVFNIVAVAIGLVLIKKGVGAKLIPVLFIVAFLLMGFVVFFGETI